MQLQNIPDTIKASVVALIGVLLTAIFALLNKNIDRIINKDGKVSDDSSKLRGELLERLRHMEDRLDQMTNTNMTLSRENAEIKIKVEMYDEDRKNVRQELKETRIALEKSLNDVITLKNEIELRNKLHQEEKESYLAKIRELESQILSLGKLLEIHKEKTNEKIDPN